MSLVLITPPAEEPISVGEAKLHCSVSIAEHDALLSGLIITAREHVENYTHRALITQTCEGALDFFPDSALAAYRGVGTTRGRESEIALPRPPLVSVASVKYLESAAGVLTTLATTEYLVDAASQPGRLTPAYGKCWPCTYPVMSAVTIRYVAGYGGAAAVPQAVKQAMLLLIGTWYNAREQWSAAERSITSIDIDDLPAVKALLAPYVMYTVGGGRF